MSKLNKQEMENCKSDLILNIVDHDPNTFSISSNSMAHGWRELVKKTWEKGKDFYDENIKIKEVRGVRIYFYRNTDFDSCFTPQMKISDQELFMDKLVSKNAYHALRKNGYGYRIHKSYGIDQKEALLDKMLKKPESKGLIINLLHPPGAPLETAVNMPNTACLAFMHFFLRDQFLDMTVTMRSQNIWTAHANYWSLRQWQIQLVRDWNIKANGNVQPGDMLVQIDNAHLYEYDWETVQLFVEQKIDTLLLQHRSMAVHASVSPSGQKFNPIPKLVIKYCSSCGYRSRMNAILDRISLELGAHMIQFIDPKPSEINATGEFEIFWEDSPEKLIHSKLNGEDFPSPTKIRCIIAMLLERFQKENKVSMNRSP